MRLRLSVHRHRLPPVKVLWTVPATASEQAYTIARLLEDVNAILPLEAEHWGLEDYVVELGGFECLHFTPVSQSLKDDDQITIRPLLTAEVRSRTLCGRNQISEGGQRLIDGIPFGRPHLRSPIRAQIRIPPRKRQRLLEDTVGGDEEVEVMGLGSANCDLSSQLNGTVSSTNNKAVHFGDIPANVEDSDGEDDEDFAPDEHDDSEGETDESSAVSSDASSSASDSDDTSSSESGSESESEDSDSEEDDLPETIPYIHTPPGKGKKNTRVRNQRRKASKKLWALKNSGQLPMNATLDDLRNWAENTPQDTAGAESLAHVSPPADSSQKKRKREDEEPVSKPTALEPNDEAELALRKQELMNQILEPSPSTAKPAASDSTPPKRLRPNVSAISRILSHQARQLDRPSPKSKSTPTKEPEQPQDPDFWKSRINLSAFECWDEEHELSAPPFPFKQHWDPASQLMRDKSKNKKKRKVANGHGQADARDSMVEDEDTIVLDYGDASGTESKPDSGPADGDSSAAIESQLLHDVATAPKPDLPSLPEDVNSLPSLEQADIKIGAIIVFRHFTLDPKNMTPGISNWKTAMVKEEGDSGNGAGVIGLKLADRDWVRREKKFDKKGNRIYDGVDKFQVDDSDDEEEDGVLEIHFTELLEAKLLQAV